MAMSRCTKQACGFKDSFEDFSKRNYKVFGVSTDKEPAQTSWAKKHGLQYKLICDPNRKVLLTFGFVKGEECMVVVSRAGARTLMQAASWSLVLRWKHSPLSRCDRKGRQDILDRTRREARRVAGGDSCGHHSLKRRACAWTGGGGFLGRTSERTRQLFPRSTVLCRAEPSPSFTNIYIYFVCVCVYVRVCVPH